MKGFWVILVHIKESLYQWSQGVLSKRKEQELISGIFPGGLETLPCFDV